MSEFLKAVRATLELAEIEMRYAGWNHRIVDNVGRLDVYESINTAIDKVTGAIHAALPLEPDKVAAEPVAWGMLSKGVIVDAICPAEHTKDEGDYTVPLYAAPPLRDLSRATICSLADRHLKYQEESSEASGVYEFVDAIIAAAKEKK